MSTFRIALAIAAGTVLVACGAGQTDFVTTGPSPAQRSPIEEPAAQVRAFVGATIIDGNGGEPIADGVVVVDGDRIIAVGPRADVEVPDGAAVVDLSGAWMTPGLVDPHIHFFSSGGLYTRPDVIDLRGVRSYERESELIQEAIGDTFRRYIASGVTAVVDVGGPFWNFDVRDRARTAPYAPRVAVAGPLVSTVARPQLDAGDPPIIRVDSPDAARALVRRQLEREPDLIKIWFILPESGDPQENLPIVTATIEEAHAAGVRVAVHATQLETARAAVTAGADILVHGVDDRDVDAEFLELLRSRNTIYTTTLVVIEGYADVLSSRVELTDVERALGSPAVIATWAELAHEPAIANAEGIAARVQRMRGLTPVAFRNLRAVHAAGITVAAGTDAGNIGTLHGPSLHRELELMAEAGLSASAILTAATRDAARVFAPEPEFGTIEPGKLADMLILDTDPLADVRNLRRIRQVVLGGRIINPGRLVPPNPEAVVQTQLDAFNARDIDAFLATYAPDVIVADFGTPESEVIAASREAMRPIYGSLFEQSPELRCTVVHRVVQGNFVIDNELVTGSRDRQPIRGVAVYEVEDGLIRRVWFLPQ